MVDFMSTVNFSSKRNRTVVFDDAVINEAFDEFFEMYFGNRVDEYGVSYVKVYRYELIEIFNSIFEYVYDVIDSYGTIGDNDLYGVIKYKFNGCFGELPTSEAVYVLVDLMKEIGEAISRS